MKAASPATFHRPGANAIKGVPAAQVEPHQRQHASRNGRRRNLPHPSRSHRPVKGLRMGIAVNENPIGSPDFRRPDRVKPQGPPVPFSDIVRLHKQKGQFLLANPLRSVRKTPESVPDPPGQTPSPRRYFRKTVRGPRHRSINPSSYPQCAFERKARSLSCFASSGRAGANPPSSRPSSFHPPPTFLLKEFRHE